MTSDVHEALQVARSQAKALQRSTRTFLSVLTNLVERLDEEILTHSREAQRDHTEQSPTHSR